VLTDDFSVRYRSWVSDAEVKLDQFSKGHWLEPRRQFNPEMWSRAASNFEKKKQDEVTAKLKKARNRESLVYRQIDGNARQYSVQIEPRSQNIDSFTVEVMIKALMPCEIPVSTGDLSHRSLSFHIFQNSNELEMHNAEFSCSSPGQWVDKGSELRFTAQLSYPELIGNRQGFTLCKGKCTVQIRHNGEIIGALDTIVV